MCNKKRKKEMIEIAMIRLKKEEAGNENPHAMLLQRCHVNAKNNYSTIYCNTLYIPPSLFSAMQYWTIQYYNTPQYTKLRCIILRYAALHYTTQHNTALHYTTQRYTALHYTTLHYTVVNSTVHTMLHHNILHNKLRCTAQHKNIRR